MGNRKNRTPSSIQKQKRPVFNRLFCFLSRPAKNWSPNLQPAFEQYLISISKLHILDLLPGIS